MSTRNILRLPNNIIIYISKLLSGNAVAKPTIDKNQLTLFDKKEMLSMVNVFRACRNYYSGPNSIFKVYYYLYEYSYKYYDVMLLAFRCGFKNVVQILYKELGFSVVNINHIGTYDSHGSIKETSSNNVNNIFFRHCKSIGYWTIKENIINVNIQDNMLMLYPLKYIYGSVSSLRWWEAIVLDEHTFPIFHKKNISIICKRHMMYISTELTVDKFEELIAKEITTNIQPDG
jgi:hypothetical protein